MDGWMDGWMEKLVEQRQPAHIQLTLTALHKEALLTDSPSALAPIRLNPYS